MKIGRELVENRYRGWRKLLENGRELVKNS